ncbi:MAG TPA: exonuclease subunit SbcD [Leucothrix sp.]|nr:exonuclease subunit SbcD [Leucothrix sp.]
MRIIHTSDWHLGQNFMGKSRAAEHQAFLGWLLEQIKSNKVDALIVAGDIFDTGSPPSYAREMYNRFIVDIQSSDCQLIVLAGNHDSVATLNESKDLLACLNTLVISSVADMGTDSVFPLKNRKGDTAAILCAVPFIRPRDVMMSQAGQSGQDKQLAMQQAISDYYHQLYKQADKLRKKHTKKHKKSLPIIATGHLATVGASTSDSVRDIYIGTLDAFPAKGFPPVDYLALGHIHQSQLVAKSEHIRYSGSPIALSFDENSQNKSVLLVDFKAGKFKKSSPLNIPCFQPMQVIKGDLKSIENQLKSLPKSFNLNENQTIWLEILVSSQDYLNDLQNRIQTMTESLPIEVLRLRRERKKQNNALQNIEKETLNELDVMDVFERRLNEETWENEEDQKRQNRIKLSFKKVLDELEAGADTP